MPKEIDIAAEMLADPLLTRIADVQKKYGLTDQEVKRLRGKIHADSLQDPIGSLEHDVVRDDRRLAAFIANLRASHKSEAQ